MGSIREVAAAIAVQRSNCVILSLLFFSFCTVLISPYSYAQSGFTAAMGGVSNDVGKRIAVDGAGNIYLAGTFEGTADFDPGANVVELTSAGNTDVFVCKLDTAGNLLWAKAMGGSGDEDVSGLAVDSTGNVYTAGAFELTTDFDPSASVFNIGSAGASDAFVSKLDASGNFVFAKAVGGIGVDRVSGLALDVSGNIFTTGVFEGVADFDPGVAQLNITSAGGSDVYVSKLDTSGDLVWAGAMGGTGADEATGIALDPSSNVHTIGIFDGVADMDPSASVFNISGANGNIFVSKLDDSGTFLWAKAMGGTGNDRANAVAVDGSGNVFTVGFFQDTADFNPGASVFNLETAGGRDIFVSKLDVSGNFVWAKGMGGTDSDEGLSVTVDNQNNIYTVGSYETMVDFDPGASTLELTSVGATDIFLSKLDSAGDLIWARSMGGAGTDWALSVSVNDTEQVLATGTFEATADFDPGPNLLNLTSAGLGDAYVSRLSRAGAVTLLGDANLDGLVNSTDALWIVQFEFGLREGLSNQTSDLNSDGLINSTDALWAIQIELGQRIQP